MPISAHGPVSNCRSINQPMNPPASIAPTNSVATDQPALSARFDPSRRPLSAALAAAMRLSSASSGLLSSANSGEPLSDTLGYRAVSSPPTLHQRPVNPVLGASSCRRASICRLSACQPCRPSLVAMQHGARFPARHVCRAFRRLDQFRRSRPPPPRISPRDRCPPCHDDCGRLCCRCICGRWP